MTQQIAELGATVRRDEVTDLLRVNEEFSTSVVIVRCHETPAGGLRWKVRLDQGLRPDITIAVRMNAGNETIRDYYLLPWIDVGSAANLKLAAENGVVLDAYRFETLDPFFDLTRRSALRAA